MFLFKKILLLCFYDSFDYSLILESRVRKSKLSFNNIVWQEFTAICNKIILWRTLKRNSRFSGPCQIEYLKGGWFTKGSLRVGEWLKLPIRLRLNLLKGLIWGNPYEPFDIGDNIFKYSCLGLPTQKLSEYINPLNSYKVRFGIVFPFASVEMIYISTIRDRNEDLYIEPIITWQVFI